MARNNPWTTSLLFVLFALLCFAVALIAVIFEVDEPKLYPGAIAAGLLSYMASHLVP